MASWDDVRRIALALPETSERPSRGHAFWRVKDKGFVWERPLRQSDLKALGAAAPKRPDPRRTRGAPGGEGGSARRRPRVFFTVPHFDGYPAVLVLLDKISLDDLEEVIVEAWLCRAPRKLAQDYAEREL